MFRTNAGFMLPVARDRADEHVVEPVDLGLQFVLGRTGQRLVRVEIVLPGARIDRGVLPADLLVEARLVQVQARSRRRCPRRRCG